MSESTTVKVPLEINPPQQTAQEKPAWARRSMHNVRMPRTQVEAEPTWTMNGPNPEIKWEPVQQPADLLPMGISETQPNIQQPQGNFMDNQSNGNQQQQAPQPPDPMGYDFYEPADVARFHQDNAAYYQQVVDARVQAALSPHMGALSEARLQQDYNAAVSRYGQDENFQECMKVALENCMEADKAGKKFSIVEEYQKANDASAARPGRRGNAHLPQAFRGKNGVGMLGRITEHNHQTGRARPFNNRNWRG